MATFSENQVRHLYVVDAKHPMTVKTDDAKTHLYMSYTGVGGSLRTDLIDPKNILWAKATDGKTMEGKLKKVTVTLDPKVNEGAPVGGQDYILRINFKQFIGMSDEDTYNKYGIVTPHTGMTVPEFFEELAVSLFRNFSREETKLVKFTMGAANKEIAGVRTIDGVPTAVDSTGAKIVATASGITITEVPQGWRRGLIEQVPVYFDVYAPNIIVGGEERVWAKLTNETDAETVNNGHKIADLEYFLLGERGDMYRRVSWPHNIETEYLVDPSKKYHILDIHYAYVGSNEGPQKSEKTLTIVAADSDKAALNKIITDFNTATGLEVEAIA